MVRGFSSPPIAKMGVLKSFTKGLHAGSLETRLADMPGNPLDWSPDGKFLLFSAFGARGLELLSLTGPRQQTPLLPTAFGEQDAKFSPDGRWIAYTSNKSGPFEVYVRSFNPEAGRVEPVEYRVSTGSGAGPRWRRDGKELYYLNQQQGVMAVRFENTKPQAARKLFQSCLQSFWAHYWQSNYDVNGDGTRFLFACPAPQPPMQVHVVVNWTSLLPRQP